MYQLLTLPVIQSLKLQKAEMNKFDYHGGCLGNVSYALIEISSF